MDESTVFVVDDDPAMRDSLSWLLGAVHLPVATFESAEDYLSKFDPERPGCILLDVRMPGMSGVELQAEISRHPQAPPVLMVTGHGDVEMAVRSLKAGAFDFIVKPFCDQALLDRVRAALRRDLEQRRRARIVQEVRERLSMLTPREWEVLRVVVEGKANKVIASELGLSPKTIEVHRARVMAKTGAGSLAELVRIAIAGGICEPLSR